MGVRRERLRLLSAGGHGLRPADGDGGPGWLHLEARYNYEGIGTGSAWVGWNFGFGEKLRLDATLMAGGIFGDSTASRRATS